MKEPHLAIRLAALFAFVAAAYFAVFNWIEHRRHVHGPWEVTFAREAGVPCLIVAQKHLQISDCKIRFPGGAVTNRNLPQTVLFDDPEKTAPFGAIPFSDLTFLPGTVTFKLFGHTVELVPRVLGIDGQEHPWSSRSVLDLPSRAEEPSTNHSSTAAPRPR